jgi:hypothetical protein
MCPYLISEARKIHFIVKLLAIKIIGDIIKIYFSRLNKFNVLEKIKRF